MFLSWCKTVYLRAEDVKVKTKAFVSFWNMMQNTRRWQWLTAVLPPPDVAQNVNAAIMWSQAGLIKSWHAQW